MHLPPHSYHPAVTLTALALAAGGLLWRPRAGIRIHERVELDGNVKAGASYVDKSSQRYSVDDKEVVYVLQGQIDLTVRIGKRFEASLDMRGDIDKPGVVLRKARLGWDFGRYSRLRIGTFQFIPWDLDHTFEWLPDTLLPSYTNGLFEYFQRIPSYRTRLLRRQRRLLDTAAAFAFLDSAYATVAPSCALDPFRPLDPCHCEQVCDGIRRILRMVATYVSAEAAAHGVSNCARSRYSARRCESFMDSHPRDGGGDPVSSGCRSAAPEPPRQRVVSEHRALFPGQTFCIFRRYTRGLVRSDTLQRQCVANVFVPPVLSSPTHGSSDTQRSKQR